MANIAICNKHTLCFIQKSGKTSRNDSVCRLHGDYLNNLANVVACAMLRMLRGGGGEDAGGTGKVAAHKYPE